MESILQKRKHCMVCFLTENLERHHVFGKYNRDNSEKYGLTVWLCARHHRDSKYGVHFDKRLDNALKQYAQRVFNIEYPDKNFVEIFGKNYLEGDTDNE